ncbi:DNA-directed RNA polymerase subunit beta' [Candidatus Parcubacteria bacterium]|nr:DNA-directed RNA polymerase subunit beta' [Candidatus Parcubacteria bacterium]
MFADPALPRLSDFTSIRLRLAAPEEILTWSHGEVTKPETINYRTQRYEKEGLFDERIFGPSKDWECYCGKYRRIRYKGVVCDKCGVEVTRAIVRREWMGHIKLATPVSHVWFLRGVPSRIGLVLDLTLPDLEKVIYFAGYIVTHVDEEARSRALDEVEREFKSRSKAETDSARKEALKKARDKAREDLKTLARNQILSEADYQSMALKYGEIFEAGTGAESIRNLLEGVNLHELVKALEAETNASSQVQRKKAVKRLKVIRGMVRSGVRPEWMFLTVLPVMPPDLRPMVQLDGGRYATSDLNDLYRRVINRNNRLKRLVELKAPEVIQRNEKRMLQEAVDALIDNSARRGQGPVAATVGQKRPLRSLADMLRGKQGRFRQNLLGKRVDYSGRSVIVVGPELKLHQCGLPKKMALELFKPFVIRELVKREIAHNIRGAGRLIEDAPDVVWAILEEVIRDRYVLLNRAPTLHRLGIQAFKPVLIEGLAIRVHPMVCSAYNADFDGDQMAVHVPLTDEAQREARELMLSSRNLLKPATGEPITVPTQDIVLGCYWLTKLRAGAKGEGGVFASPEEAMLAHAFDAVDIKAGIKVRLPSTWIGPSDATLEPSAKGGRTKKNEPASKHRYQTVETSVGRLIFNEVLPPFFPFVNREMSRRALSALAADIIERYGAEKSESIFDEIKKLGFTHATNSGVSWGMDDLAVPVEKPNLVEWAQAEVKTVTEQYQRGLLTDEERRSLSLEVWHRLKTHLAKLVPQSIDPNGSVFSIIDSGARGSWAQPVQMMGMKGIVANPAGQEIEVPVLASFKEGFNVLEYFISTHGARKGSADTALRTATAGYLTRRLVDVAQDVVIREVDCGDREGIELARVDSDEVGQSFFARLFGRAVLEDVMHPVSSEALVKSGELISRLTAKNMDEAKVSSVRVRSPISCRTRHGLCQLCYGYDLGHNELVQIGEAVGIVAAQAIGEPGTQLTMRTFHVGGVAGGGDITQGLPRVEEIFEVRPPRGKAVVADFDGTVEEISDRGNQKVVTVKGEHGSQAYLLPVRTQAWVSQGDLVGPGTALCEGHVDLKDLMRVSGVATVQRYIIKEVQRIYTTEGAAINDKHIEIIVRQMFSRVRVQDSGDTNLTSGEIVEKLRFDLENDEARAKGGVLATATPVLLGITKVSLTTDSFLSAASFQETARVLITAALEGREDQLRGLKENVIIGRLIPAGTGFRPSRAAGASTQDVPAPRRVKVAA